ncbi:MAG: DUF3251 domain-containing protein [Candidatus Malihini olakiniferum]
MGLINNKILLSDTQTQPLTLDAWLLPKTEALFGVRLSGIIPEQLGFVCSHHAKILRLNTKNPCRSRDFL